MKKSLVIFMSAVLAVSMLCGCGKKADSGAETKVEEKADKKAGKDADKKPESNDKKADNSANTVDKSDMAVVNGEEKQVSDNGKFYMPQVMYFVSEKDADYDAEIKIFNELKEEYKDTVEFDLRDIDKNPEDKTNFPVEGMTPVLIMLDTANNISAMEFMCADKDKLKSSIDSAFNGMQEDMENGKIDAHKRAE